MEDRKCIYYMWKYGSIGYIYRCNPYLPALGSRANPVFTSRGDFLLNLIQGGI